MDWFLYDNDLCHERNNITLDLYSTTDKRDKVF